jgi:hypothetical protein
MRVTGRPELLAGLRRSAGRVDCESQRGGAHHPGDTEDQQHGEVQQPALLEHVFAEIGDVGESGRRPLLQARDLGARAAAEDGAVAQRGGAQHQDVDADAGDDLVGAQRDAEEACSQATGSTHEHARTRGPPAASRWRRSRPRRRRRR